jgi:hypothetical protein
MTHRLPTEKTLERNDNEPRREPDVSSGSSMQP